MEAKFCKQICVWKLSPRSTQCTPLHLSLISKFSLKTAEMFADFFQSLTFAKFARISLNKPLSGPRRRAPRPERGAWRRLCTAWVHSRKPCKRRTANRNEQKFTVQKRTCAIWNDSVGLIQHFSSRWPCRPLFRKCNNTSEHEFRRNGSCAAIRWKEKHHRVKL